MTWNLRRAKIKGKTDGLFYMTGKVWYINAGLSLPQTGCSTHFNFSTAPHKKGIDSGVVECTGEKDPWTFKICVKTQLSILWIQQTPLPSPIFGFWFSTQWNISFKKILAILSQHMLFSYKPTTYLDEYTHIWHNYEDMHTNQNVNVKNEQFIF